MREVHDVALLIGYGAAAVNPYLAIDSVAAAVAAKHVEGPPGEARPEEPQARARAIDAAIARYVHALDEDRLEEWPNFFVEAGSYRITTAENRERGLPLAIIYADSRAMLRDRVTALRTANIY